MEININFKEFKKNHHKKINQVLFTSQKCKDYKEVENIFKFL